MTTPTPERAPRPMTTGRAIVGILAFIGGALAFIVIDFILSAGNVSSSGFKEVGAGQIAISWVITIGAYWILHKTHRWAGYGMLAGVVGLFMLLTLSSANPSTCFNTYGYPYR